MELTQHGLLEELIMGRESWSTVLPGGLMINEFFPSDWSLEAFDNHRPDNLNTNTSLLGLLTQSPETGFACPFNYSFADSSKGPELSTSPYDHHQNINDTSPNNQAAVAMAEDGELSINPPGKDVLLAFEDGRKSAAGCGTKVENLEIDQANANIGNSSFSVGLCGGETKSKIKKLEGLPSKNLMAERRRRKRLNDRLSMLRSIVPKISKMDRTSILGDTIDYMKELLDKIHKIQEEDDTEVPLLGNLNHLKQNEASLRNPPKFNVERRDMDTRIEICCGTKPGLLLSTVSTIEALGLDIQQCVISCFNDFSLRASCSEVEEHRTIISQEDVKQALFRTAGYGGRCL